jgi:hypothetical protein
LVVGLALNFVIRKGEGHQARWVGAGSGGISAIIRAGKKTYATITDVDKRKRRRSIAAEPISLTTQLG